MLVQPANTWSSSAYVLIGNLMLALSYDRDRIRRYPGFLGAH
jgi:hypothetical protein